jgi:hypothetical protein
MNNLSHLNPGKCNDKAGVTGGVSELTPANPTSVAPPLTTESSSPGFVTERIAKNPTKTSAKKGGRSFDIC